MKVKIEHRGCEKDAVNEVERAADARKKTPAVLCAAAPLQERFREVADDCREAEDQPEAADKFLRTIERHANRLAFLIEDLLTLSRLESSNPGLKLENIHLGTLISGVVEDVHRAMHDLAVAMRVAVGEEMETVEAVAEPFLVRTGLMARTSRGRVATPQGFTHLGHKSPQGWTLFDSGFDTNFDTNEG